MRLINQCKITVSNSCLSSIRNELAEKHSSSSSASGRSNMMMDTDAPIRPAFSSAYEPRDSLASREEYRIGNRFSTQGMAIDYQFGVSTAEST